MVGKELAVDGPAASVTILDVMPEVDSCFAEVPAKIHFFSVIQRGEVQQAFFRVLKLATRGCNLFDGTLQRFDRGLLSISEGNYLISGRHHPARDLNPLIDAIQLCFRLIVLLFQRDDFPQFLFNFGQHRLCFDKGEVSRH